eukprot:3484060-Rhodomonas_salina.1
MPQIFDHYHHDAVLGGTIASADDGGTIAPSYLLRTPYAMSGTAVRTPYTLYPVLPYAHPTRHV